MAGRVERPGIRMNCSVLTGHRNLFMLSAFIFDDRERIDKLNFEEKARNMVSTLNFRKKRKLT